MPDQEKEISVAEAIMQPLDDKVNRNSKDSVFCELFSRPEYFLELYKVLHPEDTDVTANDLTLVTLSSLMLKERYNDLGILVRDRLLVMVEAQSVFTMNILVRFLLYLAETYNRYINRMNLNVYGTKKVSVPMPELYVIYHGDRGDRPDEIRLSKEIFGLANPTDAFVDVKAKIIYDSKQGDIINQYVTFARAFDSQIALYGYTQKAVDETIRICKDQNVLSAFLAEEEVATIMFTMADEEKARKFWEEELKSESEMKGEERVLLKSIRALMKSMQWNANQAMDALQIPAADRSIYASML